MPDTQEERIRAAFTLQAATFEDARLNVAFTSSVPWLLDHMEAGGDDIVLDVAGGTGIVSRALADRVARVVVVDSTPAMLEEGRRHAAAERLTNLEFVRGAVANLPFADAAFTLVFARFLLHHLIGPRPALAEMVRVCRPGGRVVVMMDLAASTDPVIAERQDQIERLRDPSHVRMPPLGTVRRWLQADGLLIDGVAEKEIDRPVLPWLEQAVTDPAAAAQVCEVFDAELAGGTGTGMRPHRAADGARGSANCGRSPRRARREPRAGGLRQPWLSVFGRVDRRGCLRLQVVGPKQAGNRGHGHRLFTGND